MSASQQSQPQVQINELKVGPNTKIVRNPDEFITPDVLNEYEVARIIEWRAIEIANGHPYDVTLLNELPPDKKAEDLAELELKYGLIPYTIYRKIGQNVYEEWSVENMYYRDD